MTLTSIVTLSLLPSGSECIIILDPRTDARPGQGREELQARRGRGQGGDQQGQGGNQRTGGEETTVRRRGGQGTDFLGPPGGAAPGADPYPPGVVRAGCGLFSGHALSVRPRGAGSVRERLCLLRTPAPDRGGVAPGGGLLHTGVSRQAGQHQPGCPVLHPHVHGLLDVGGDGRALPVLRGVAFHQSCALSGGDARRQEGVGPGDGDVLPGRAAGLFHGLSADVALPLHLPAQRASSPPTSSAR